MFCNISKFVILFFNLVYVVTVFIVLEPLWTHIFLRDIDMQ